MRIPRSDMGFLPVSWLGRLQSLPSPIILSCPQEQSIKPYCCVYHMLWWHLWMNLEMREARKRKTRRILLSCLDCEVRKQRCRRTDCDHLEGGEEGEAGNVAQPGRQDPRSNNTNTSVKLGGVNPGQRHMPLIPALWRYTQSGLNS